MFWDKMACVYDLFADIYNRKAHRELKRVVAEEIKAGDTVLECACGTGLLTAVIAPRCKQLTATDFSAKMLERTKKKCGRFANLTLRQANILSLSDADESYDAVVAANVIHLLDEPRRALAELNRVCKTGGRLIVPTYMNRERSGQPSGFSQAVGKAGADFRQAFTFSAYQRFLRDAGYPHARFRLIEGRVPCAVAVIVKES